MYTDMVSPRQLLVLLSHMLSVVPVSQFSLPILDRQTG